MIHGKTFIVYKLVNKNTGRAYYGRTCNPVNRLRGHLTELHNKQHYNTEMQRDHAPGVWEFIPLVTDLGQVPANKLSDKYAKEDDTCYNRLGVVASNPHGSKRVLTKDSVQSIRELYFGGEYNQPQLAKLYGVTQGLISLIVNGLVHNDGTFSPPLPPSNDAAHSRGKYNRHKLRARHLQLAPTMRSNKIVKKLCEEFNLSPSTVRFWLKNEPKDTGFASSTNLSHYPRVRRCEINGVMYWSGADWERQTGGDHRSLIKLAKRKYITNDQRTVMVDGAPVLIGQTHLTSTLRALGYPYVRRVKEGVYETVPYEELSPYQQETLARYKMKKSLTDAVDRAMADPVRAKSSGRVMLHRTADKHGVPVSAVRARLRAAAPADS